MKGAALAWALAGTIMAASPALATPITYIEQVTATGSLGEAAFTNASIVLTLHGDTVNIAPGPGFFSFVNSGTATVSVNGGPAAAFKDIISAFVDQTASFAGFFDSGRPGDILGVAGTAFAAYDLRTPIGPISGNALIEPEVDFFTKDGAFILLSAQRGTATFTATTSSAVLEPSSLALLGAGLLMLGIAARRKRGARALPRDDLNTL